MSEVRLVIREADQDWSGIVHGSEADYAIAALSADPMTLSELEVALGRYRKPVDGRSFFANRSAGIYDEPHDAGLIVIDLVARLVVTDSTYSSPGPDGDVLYHDGHSATDKWLRYYLAENWLFVEDRMTWRAIAAERREETAAHPPLDARSVFYGRPLLEFVAREIFAAHSGHETMDVEPEETIRKIHIAWLMTPRDDLGGICPRDVAHSDRQRIMGDLQHQANRWSRLDECPPGLDESSFAFRYGGFGTHELVMYYDLVRELLWSAREHLVERSGTQPQTGGPDALTLGDYLTTEIPRLESVRDTWLDTPDPDCHGRTPRSIIDRERARLPEGVCGRDAIVDPDCPCCQMLAELPGPAFWHLDGCEMDNDYAFDLIHETREEWEADQREWKEFDRRLDAEHEERRRLGVTHSAIGEPGRSVWSSSFSVGDTVDVPLGIRLFGIGGHLAELIVRIRTGIDSASMPEAQQLIEHLNRDFGNLRDILQASEPQVADALIEPVIDHFAATLREVAAVRTELSSRCEHLTNILTRFLLPPSPETSGDEGDWETPF